MARVKGLSKTCTIFRDEASRDPSRPPVDSCSLVDDGSARLGSGTDSSFMRRKKGVNGFKHIGARIPDFLYGPPQRLGGDCCLVGGGQEINTGGSRHWMNGLRQCENGTFGDLALIHLSRINRQRIRARERFSKQSETALVCTTCRNFILVSQCGHFEPKRFPPSLRHC